MNGKFPSMAVKVAVVGVQQNSKGHHFFADLARKTAAGMGSPWAFLVAVGIILLWGLAGPMFRYSDTWQLVINTGTTIVTFLMVFLIQNTQNRDAKAMHLKLDELIVAVEAAHNQMLDIESLSDEELADLETRFQKLRAACSDSSDDSK
jgi:low affinity Fe/Cu permease